MGRQSRREGISGERIDIRRLEHPCPVYLEVEVGIMLIRCIGTINGSSQRKLKSP